MSYTTEANLRDALGHDVLVKISDRDGSGNIGSTVVTRAIQRADAIIDGYLAARYSVPFTTVPDIVRFMSEDIAKFNLLTTSLQGRSFSEQIYNDWRAEYKTAIDMLKMYAEGEQEIPGESAGGMDPTMSVERAGDDVEHEFTETLHTVGGDDVDTGEEGSMDTW